ncbi:MAG: tRNA (adenosine(37)-N6)-threonylcarbamoyltransferase complex transferase subunit TsaD [Pelagibacteraceae bacterium]|nr:tRNA (adenosine(37)-N6)-threonylcarbamoyltransferase complex transferase subunit TsaD [Pelagibacteraceae bacterium]
MLVFAIESSCDETSVCIMRNDKKIFSHIVYSQHIHNLHGGVVPELASRAHLEVLQLITKQAFRESNINLDSIDAFAATCGPGLIGGLLVGSTYAKSMSIGAGKPFIPINHLEAHISSTSYNNEIRFPHLIALLTGGHTQIYLMLNQNKMELISESVDDAIGEAFDKVAKMLGLKYPGGAEIEKKAKNGNENFFNFPKPVIKKNNLNFSFSGLKTSANILIKKNKLEKKFVNNVCAGFQKTVSDILSEKLIYILKHLSNKYLKIASLSVVGGVANNVYIKNKLENITKKNNILLYYPIKEMLSDNAAMIAWNCIEKKKYL